MVVTNGYFLRAFKNRVEARQQFKVSMPQHWLIQALVHYLNQNPVFEQPKHCPTEIKAVGTLSLQKGIALFGPPGIGKTAMLRTMFEHLFFHEGGSRSHQWREAHRYEEIDPSLASANHAFLNEVGADYARKDFGTLVDPVYDFLYRRHQYQEAQLQRRPDAVYRMHLTSNLTSQQFLERYDARLLDRLKEMCNILILDFPSFRH